MSAASSIAVFLSAALAQVSTTNGYLTNCGVRVYRGRRRLHPDVIPCIVIFEGDEQVLEHGTKHQVRVAARITIEAHDVCDPDNPNDKAHDMVADIKRCVFSGDIKLGGVAHRLEYKGRIIGENVEGTSYVSASVALDVTHADKLDSP